MPTVRAQVAAGGSVALSALALAGWCQYLIGTSNHGTPIELSSDPALDEAVAYANKSIAEPTAFLGFELVFDDQLAQSAALQEAFTTALTILRSDGGVPAGIEWAITEAGGSNGRSLS